MPQKSKNKTRDPVGLSVVVVIVHRDQISFSPTRCSHVSHKQRMSNEFPHQPQTFGCCQDRMSWAIAWGQVILFTLKEKGRMRVVGRLTYGNNARAVSSPQNLGHADRYSPIARTEVSHAIYTSWTRRNEGVDTRNLTLAMRIFHFNACARGYPHCLRLMRENVVSWTV